jgi:hypothetical protein
MQKNISLQTVHETSQITYSENWGWGDLSFYKCLSVFYCFFYCFFTSLTFCISFETFKAQLTCCSFDPPPPPILLPTLHVRDAIHLYFITNYWNHVTNLENLLSFLSVHPWNLTLSLSYVILLEKRFSYWAAVRVWCCPPLWFYRDKGRCHNGRLTRRDTLAPAWRGRETFSNFRWLSVTGEDKGTENEDVSSLPSTETTVSSP